MRAPNAHEWRLLAVSAGFFGVLVSTSCLAQLSPDSAASAATQLAPLATQAAAATQWPPMVSAVGQAIEALASLGLFIYVAILAKDLRESTRARHLDGMKYVRELIGTPAAAELRRWVYQELSRQSMPLSDEAVEMIRRVGRDFDHIGLLSRKGLLPADIIANTYNRNITDMWNRLGKAISELRVRDQRPDYFVEFEWLADRAMKAGAIHDENARQRGLPKW